MEAQLSALRAARSPGVFLQMHEGNTRAARPLRLEPRPDTVLCVTECRLTFCCDFERAASAPEAIDSGARICHCVQRRFYERLGFRQLVGIGEPDAAGTGGAFYMGLRLGASFEKPSDKTTIE
eukprot:5560183-Prymnesium_polylepis.2